MSLEIQGMEIQGAEKAAVLVLSCLAMCTCCLCLLAPSRPGGAPSETVNDETSSSILFRILSIYNWLFQQKPELEDVNIQSRDFFHLTTTNYRPQPLERDIEAGLSPELTTNSLQ